MSAATLILFTLAATIANVLGIIFVKSITKEGETLRAALMLINNAMRRADKAHELAFDAQLGADNAHLRINKMQKAIEPEKAPRGRPRKIEPATSGNTEIPFEPLTPPVHANGQNSDPGDEHPDRKMLDPAAIAAGL